MVSAGELSRYYKLLKIKLSKTFHVLSPPVCLEPASPLLISWLGLEMGLGLAGCQVEVEPGYPLGLGAAQSLSLWLSRGCHRATWGCVPPLLLCCFISSSSLSISYYIAILHVNIHNINVVAMSRRGYSDAEIEAVKDGFKRIFKENGSSFDERIQSLSESYPEFECVQCLCDAMKLSSSGKHGRSNEKNVTSQSAKVSS